MELSSLFEMGRWIDGRTFVTALKRGSERMISDRSQVGDKGEVSLGAAPVSMEKLKVLCTEKGAKLEAARIGSARRMHILR